MERLRQKDLRAALGLLEALGGASNLDEFAGLLALNLGKVIPSDFVAYNEVNPVQHRAFFVSDRPIEAELPGATATLARHMEDNPLVGYFTRTRDGSAHTWSDFISQRELHSTRLWNGLFRPFGIERQMVITLPAPGPLLVGVVLNRGGADFSDRERRLLDLLRPHLANAYANAQARSALRVAEDAEALILVGALGEPLWMTPLASRLLAPFREAPRQELPGRLVAWCRQARSRLPYPAEPLLISHEGRTLEARLLAGEVVSLRMVHDRIDPASLQSLGLRAREREVLALVAEGLTNGEVARRLQVEPSTVKKHLESIYQKLAVTTRTGAAALAFRAADTATGTSAWRPP